MTDLHNHALEARIIGTAFASAEAATAYAIDHSIAADHFTLDAHRTLWNVIAHRLDADAELDEIGLVDVVTRKPDLVVGGVQHDDLFVALSRAVEEADAAANADHAKHLRDLAERRRLIGGLDQVRRQVLQLDTPLSEAVTAITETAYGADITGRSGPQVNNVHEGMFRRIPTWEKPPAQAGFGFGFKGLDRVMSLRPGTMTVIAARPSIGKSLFVQQVISNVVHKHQVRALLISLEMDENELLDRVVPYEAEVPSSWLARPKRKDDPNDDRAWKRVMDVGDDHALKRFEYVDDVDLAITDIRSLVQRHRAKHPDFQVLVLDYIGLVRHTDPKQMPVHAIAEISRQLKVIAINLQIAVVALSQLSRGPETDKRAPRLSDLRDSGAIEQDADHVLFLHAQATPGVFGSDAAPSAATEIIVAKNRSGQRNVTVPLGFDGSIPKFLDHSGPTGPPLPGQP